MPLYCDSIKLELNWFHWILASKVPDLEKYRKLGLLWTKTNTIFTDDGTILTREGQPLGDHSYPIRTHCIALASPVYFDSENGRVNHDLLPEDESLSLTSDAPILFHQMTVVLPTLKEQGFLKEIPTITSWHAMLEDIKNICAGISTKFSSLPDEHQDLTHEAFLQVIRKLVNYKLLYKPGKAPVFNLLTTTIHRIMFSIMNKQTQQRNNSHTLMEKAKNGQLPDNRSLRVHTGCRIKSH